ncbi:GNAT family N-acetyltransferase [Lentzea aerocolonigenes]|uniref:GNAT family N-acetyltransferase n=1 Tax=Lentzea aerocolonigenes TaxID=68170 RepID=UPI000697876D|nr:N-acetyltransferase [Lentzea aerocolonigenes]
MTIRPARRTDTGVAELQHGSAPDLLDEVFGADVLAFLARDFRYGRGIYGFRQQLVVDVGGAVAASCTVYRGGRAGTLSAATALTVVRHYGAAAARVLRRSLAVGAAFSPPARDGLLLANLCTAESVRGQGIGTALVEHVVALARASGSGVVELDVSTANPRAQLLYERLGFEVAGERAHRLGGDRFRRMRRLV